MFFNANLGVSTLKDNDLSIDELLLLSLMWNFERDNKPCYQGREKTARQFNCSVAKIERLYKSLKDKKYIFVSGKTKKLTQKAITFCMGVMHYNMSERQKKKVRHPSWLKKELGKEQVSKDKEAFKAFKIEKSEEERKEQIKEQIKDVFGDNVKIKD